MQYLDCGLYLPVAHDKRFVGISTSDNINRFSTTNFMGEFLVNRKKIFASLLLGYSALHLSSAKAACTVDQYIADAPQFTNVAAPTVTGTLCGQTVTMTNLSGNNLNTLSAGNFLDVSGALYYGQQNVQLTAPVQISVNGQIIFSGSLVTPSAFTSFLQALGFSTAQPYLSAASMANTSASAKVSDVVYSRVINPVMQTRSQWNQHRKENKQNLRVFLADMKYESGEFRHTNDSGDIAGFTAGASYDLDNNFTVGAIVPYDYLDFNSFNAHRTGVILYGKKLWNLFNNLELSTAINGNYLYTDTQFDFTTDQMSTYGGGFSTRLMHDDGGDFVSAAVFSFQYNQDDREYRGNHQYLVKIGPTLGYRVADNALVQVSGVWNKDATYRIKGIDTDFFDLGIEGSWFISDLWQLRGGFKKILDYNQYESDSVYLGSSVKF